jgi:hypothetical protein
MRIPRRHLLLGLCSAFAGCGPAVAPTPPAPATGKEKHFIRKPLLKLDVERRIVEDAATGRKNLRLLVDLVSEESLMDLRDLRLIVIMVGTPVVPDRKAEGPPKWRMILSREIPVSLRPGQKFQFESPLIESGEGDPFHVNYNIAYRGWAVRLENKYGETCTESSSESALLLKLPEWRKVAEGSDFTP